MNNYTLSWFYSNVRTLKNSNYTGGDYLGRSIFVLI